MSAVDAALLLLRVCLGITMAAHGCSKLFMGGKIAGASNWFSSLGLRPGALHAWLAVTCEISAGIALAVGLLTPLAGAAFVSLMLVAAWTVHRQKGFFIAGGGWEYTFVVAIAGIAIAIAGPGTLSLDWAIFGEDLIRGWLGLLISAAGGTVAGLGLLTVFYRPQTVPAPSSGVTTSKSAA
jgi:putative oxidoreductase